MTGRPEEGPVEESVAEEAADASVDPPVDPPTEPASDASQADSPEPVPEEASVEQQLVERTLDLQRLQAEYVNYKRRVDRDRAVMRTQGEASVLRSLLTVLDDLGRAEEHGQLEGGFKAVADALQQAVKAHGLEVFGARGDAFDPRLHEALFHAGESAEVEATTIDSVVRTGYRKGDEVLRHAQVGVVDPAAPAPETDPDDAVSTDAGTDTED